MTAPLKLRRITLATPKIGGKCFLINEPGLYVLEEGPGVLRTIPVTHAGSGSLVAFDGVPDADGRFPDDEMREFDDEGARNPDFDARRGRSIYRATPAVMGSWMLDGGFYHGLTIHADGGAHGVALFATVVWMPVRVK